MIAASNPVQRPPDAKLLFISRRGTIENLPRSAFCSLLRPGDLVVANDAATMPASLFGTHIPTRRPIEVRLAGRRSLDRSQVRYFFALLFGAGNFRTRTEDRALPPSVNAGDRLQLGPLLATVACVLNHPRLVLLRFDGSASEFWEGLARHGRPIQYSHINQPLALWDTWSPIAGPPVAFEPPSAGFVLSWEVLASLSARGIQFATITHAAGLSSTGDPTLDALLPLDEPYFVPAATAGAIARTRTRQSRLIAVGTTVVRALEHATSVAGRIRPEAGLATQKIGPGTRLRAVDAMLSGTHERGTSHYELLRAFATSATLDRMDQQLDLHRYRTHEFGDSILIERDASNEDAQSDDRSGANAEPLPVNAGGADADIAEENVRE